MHGRRTWPQRLLIAFNVVCVVGALGTAGVLAYFNDKLGDVTRIQLGGDTLREEEERPPGAALNYLLVGADDATGSTGVDTIGRGNVTGARTDTIMVLRVDPKDTTARLDRGASPPAVRALVLDVEGGDFLKPTVVEASADAHTWSEIGRASIFATGTARMTTLRFAPSDRRHLRVRLDDRNGPPVRLRSARLPPRRS